MRVINQGSTEFTELRLNMHSETVDFPAIARKLLSKVPTADKNRGNLQENILFSGGENHVRNPTANFGCAIPGINNGTEEWIPLAIEMSTIAKKLGIPWANRSTLSETDMERNRLFSWSVHEDNIFEGITLALLQLFPTAGKVKEHTDHFNCSKRTHTILFSEIVCIEGKVYRVCIIAYMRKSCRNAMIRIKACEEVVRNARTYIQSLPAVRKPLTTMDGYLNYYKSLGTLGIGLIVDKPKGEFTNPTVHSVALLTAPHMDKPMSYLSPVAAAVADIYSRNGHLTREDLYLMCLPVGQLNSTFTYGSVLAALQCEAFVANDGPLGVLSTIIEGLKSLSGSYSSGSFCRSQVSWQYKELNVGRVYKDIETLMRLCSSSSECPPAGTDYESYCLERCQYYVKILKNKIQGVGEFGAQHLLTVLAQLNLLHPVGIVHCGQLATSTSTLRSARESSTCNNPRMREYLDNCSDVTQAVKSQRSDRARRVVAAVVPYMRAQEDTTWMTSSLLDQINCESYRGKTVVDPFFPHSRNLIVPSFSSSDPVTLVRAFTDGNGALQVASKGQSAPPELRQPSAMTESQAAKMVQLEGPKPDKLYIRIPYEYLSVHESLMADIRNMFFNNNMKVVLEWIEGHPTLMALIKHFSVHRATVGIENNHGNRSRKRPLDFLSLPKATPVMELDRCNELPPPLNPPDLNGIEPEAVSIEVTGNIDLAFPEPQQTQPKGDFPAQFGEKEPEENGNQSPKRVKISKRGKVAKTEKEPIITIVSTDDGVRMYRFETFPQYAHLATMQFPTMKTERKVIAQCRHEIDLGPLLAQVKRCLFYGQHEAEFTSPLTKATLVAHKCCEKIYSLPATTRSKSDCFLTSWQYNHTLPITTAGLCMLVDNVAVSIGGFKAEVRHKPGLYHWLFPTPEQSRRHYIQCLMLLLGSPAYFDNLKSKIYAKLQAHAVQPNSTVPVLLTSNSNLLGKRSRGIFYAIVTLNSAGYVDNWGLVPFVPEKQQSPGLAPPLILDGWTWKKNNRIDNTVLGMVKNKPRSSRSKKREQSITDKRVWHETHQSLELNMEVAFDETFNEISTVTDDNGNTDIDDAYHRALLFTEPELNVTELERGKLDYRAEQLHGKPDKQMTAI